MLPSLLTCVVGKSIDNSVRLSASDVIKYVYDNFADKCKTLGPRIVNTLSKTWLDKEKDENVQLGAVRIYYLLNLRNYHLITLF